MLFLKADDIDAACYPTSMGQFEYLIQAFGRRKPTPGKHGKLLLIDDIFSWCKSKSLKSMLVSLLRMDTTVMAHRVFVVATYNPETLEGGDSLDCFMLPGGMLFSSVRMQNLRPDERAEQLTNLISSSHTALQFQGNQVISETSSNSPSLDPQYVELVSAVTSEISMDTGVSKRKLLLTHKSQCFRIILLPTFFSLLILYPFIGKGF